MPELDKKWDVNKFPEHMKMDAERHNANAKTERIMCTRCEGTGNELFSMYRKCRKCDGRGYLKAVGRQRTIKVFKMNEDEWWAGEDLESCVKAYMEVTGLSRDEAVDEPREVPAEEMEKLIYHDDEKECSFAAELKRSVEAGDKFPDIFASTEY